MLRRVGHEVVYDNAHCRAGVETQDRLPVVWLEGEIAPRAAKEGRHVERTAVTVAAIIRLVIAAAQTG
jgi:hypothetical protein